jgi:ABC-type nitrate/sulfonate/bicarbonate transport system permease component
VTAAAAPAAAGRSPGRGPVMRGATQRAAGWLGLLAVAALWQLVAVILHKTVFPTFGSAMAAVGQVLGGPVLTRDILPSIARALAGFGISGVIGIVAGLTLGYARRIGDYCTAVIDFLRSLPAPLLVPLAIVLLGLGGRMVVAVVVAAAVWPVLINAFDAARRTEPLYLDAARACGLHGLPLLRVVLLPAALPMVLAGLRIALSTSLAVLVVAEMLGASSGIGYFIQDAQQTFQVPQTYAGIIVLAALGWIFDTAFLFAEHRLLRWEKALTGGANA